MADIISEVIISGDLEALKSLDLLPSAWTAAACDTAAKHNHFDALKWMCEEKGAKPNSYANHHAAVNNNLKMMEWLHDTHGVPVYGYMSTHAAEHGNIEMLDYLHKNGAVANANISDIAFKAKNMPMLEWIHRTLNGYAITQMTSDADEYYRPYLKDKVNNADALEDIEYCWPV